MNPLEIGSLVVLVVMIATVLGSYFGGRAVSIPAGA